MANNKTKTDRLHGLLPKHLNTRTNVNWNGLLSAIGDADQATADLIAEVRQQFFVKTATRPYIDVLAANHKISRPKLVGMSDASFREYIPVLSYKPKQVKLIIDALLDIFFFKESTTAFMSSSNYQPFNISNGWELEYLVDGEHKEKITFNAADFTDISAATADEIVASFNRQATHSYATNFYDSITKRNFIRVFSNTVGSKGSLEMVGGRANIALRFNGFIADAGNGNNTQWTVTKVGDLTTFTHTGGASPGIDKLQVGDILISDIAGNKGSFPIVEVDVSNSKIKFKNLFSTVGVYIQLSDSETKYVRPEKYVAFKKARRAITWETSPGEIVVEMPTNPPVVQRSLKGSLHINGAFSTMTSRNSDTSLTLLNATGFPKSGSFYIEPVNAVTSRILTSTEDEVVTNTYNGRLIYDLVKYEYASRVAVSTTGSVVAGSKVIAVASVAGISQGMTIFMDGIRQDATVVGIDGLNVISSVAATSTVSNVDVDFGSNTLTGITPSLPDVGSLNQFTLSSLSRSSGVITATTASAHGYEVGETAIISGSSGINVTSTTGNIVSGSKVVSNLASISNVSPGQLVIGTGIPSGAKVTEILSPTSIMLDEQATATSTGVSLSFNDDINGSYTIKSATSNQFTYHLLGTNGSASTPGTSRVERAYMNDTNSKIILTDAQSSDDTRIKGAYVWDPAAPYVLSSATATTQENIQAGTIVRLVNISDNEIPSEAGFIVFNYGQQNQEGPIRYLYKPASNTIAIDPSYVFQKTHAAGSPVVALRKKGPHIMDGQAGEYAPYITDPSEAREILKELIRSVKSAGIFVNFLIRFPEQLYGTIDVYKSGVDPG